MSATPAAESYSQLFHQAKALRLDLWAGEKNFYAWHKKYGVQDLVRANGRFVETYKKVRDSVWSDFRGICSVVDRQSAMSDFVEASDEVVELEDCGAMEMCSSIRRDGIIYVDGAGLSRTPLWPWRRSVCRSARGLFWMILGRLFGLGTLSWTGSSRFKGVKTAILTNFKHEVSIISERYCDVEITDDFKRFRDMGESGWFLGSWQRFARGVDLSSAAAMVITCCPWSAEGLEQGRDGYCSTRLARFQHLFISLLSRAVLTL